MAFGASLSTHYSSTKMIENIVIGLVFVGAVAYLVSTVRRQFSAKSSGCASCSGNCQVSKIEIPVEKS